MKKKKPPPKAAPGKGGPVKKAAVDGQALYIGGAVALVLFVLLVRWWWNRRNRVAPGEHAPLPDDNKLGQYFISRLLADGGTASVYRATDTNNTPVAIKIPHADQLLDRNFVATFQREAGIGVELRHPSIVRVIEAGAYRRGRFARIPYFVMELLDGRDLGTMLREQGRLDPLAAAQIARSVADALQWAHHRGVVHRDISPRNILITTKMLVKVMDFGISTVRSRTGKRAQQGVALNFGTPEYIAPERINGAQADERSDLYALGCVFYEMVVGQPPFQGKTPLETLKLHRKAPVPKPSASVHLPREVEQIILRLLEKDPAQRDQKAAEVTSELAELVPSV